MTAQATVVIDKAGLNALLSAGQAAAFLSDRAHAMVGEAERIAPGGFMGYKRQFVVGPASSKDGVASVPAGSTSSGWHLVEFGSANNVPHRVLERAARAAGLEYRPVG